MSEYQYVSFRAIESPVSESDLEYMHRQSSRAEITPWAFDNQYSFGDFRGDALEMLRRGYEIHLHYANFGIRKLLLRFPHGLPNVRALKPYLSQEGLTFVNDKRGSGGILCLEPYHEPGDLEEVFNIEDYIELLVPLRAEILDGDLRPLYLAHLAAANSSDHDPEETIEAPVPAGLGNLTAAQQALAELYDLKSLIEAAAQQSPQSPTLETSADPQSKWIKQQSQSMKDQWLTQLISADHANVRGEVLTAFRAQRPVAEWPTVRCDRTISQLRIAADQLQQVAALKAAEAVVFERKKKLAAMAVKPEAILRETEKLVQQRSVSNYREIAKLLSELREALQGTKRFGIAAKQAEKLVAANPTLNSLRKELRGEGFLPK